MDCVWKLIVKKIPCTILIFVEPTRTAIPFGVNISASHDSETVKEFINITFDEVKKELNQTIGTFIQQT